MADSASIEKAFKEAEPQLFRLTEADFKSSTARGNWLVFYGSKFCIHCQKFTPDWLKLQNIIKQNEWEPTVRVAKVECTEDKELCKDLLGWPTVYRFQDGKRMEEIEERELDYLVNYCKELYEETIKMEGTKGFAALKELLDKETGEKASINPSGTAVEVTDKTIKPLTQGKPWLLMFYAPWCGHCKTFKPTFHALAKDLKNTINVGLVDCTTEKQACQDYKIKGYPTLYFANEPERIQYTGRRTKENVIDFALTMSSQPSFTPIKAAGLKKLIMDSEKVAIFVYNGENQRDLQTIYSVAKSIKGKIPFYICPEEAGFAELGISPQPSKSTLAIFTDNGLKSTVHKGVYVDTEKNKRYITNWVLDNQYALVTRLGIENESLMRSSDYLVVSLIDPDDKGHMKILKDLKKDAKKWHEDHPGANLKFLWLDAMEFTNYISQVYGVYPKDLPRYVIAYTPDEIYYYQDSAGHPFSFETKSLFEAIQNSMDGKGKPGSVKGFVGLAMYKTKKGMKSAYSFVTSSALGLISVLGFIFFSVYFCCLRKPQYAKVASGPKSDSKED